MHKLNKERAARIDAAMKGYARVSYGSDNQEPKETQLSDMLTDLQHWAERQGLDFDGRLDHARDNYRAERINPLQPAAVEYPAPDRRKRG